MNAFVRPKTVDEAIELMASNSYRLLAGGTDIYPASGPRLMEPVLDLTSIESLSGIRREDGLWIGAVTTWSQLAQASLPPACRALQQAALQVGGRQIQNAGTIAGNLCNASPAADGVPPLLVLDAQVELAGPKERRSLGLSDFLKGPRQTAKRPDEIVTGIRIPASALEGDSAFSKLGARAYLVISIAMVAVRVTLDKGKIANSAIAVGSCSATARRIEALEAALVGSSIADAPAVVESVDMDAFLHPINDVRATAEYRLSAAKSLIKRTLVEVLA